MSTAPLPVTASADQSADSWHPGPTADTATLAYWLNWRLLFCAVWVILSMIVASVLIWRYECSDEDAGSQQRRRQGTATSSRLDQQQQRHPEEEAPGVLYEDDCWRPCLKEIHPVWLLAYRVSAFVLLTTLLLVYVSYKGPTTFYYYTQWTFSLVIVYFGLGSMISSYGCYKFTADPVYHRRFDPEHAATYAPPATAAATATPSTAATTKRPSSVHRHQEHQMHHRKAGVLGYTFQIIYQTNAGAVMLTDVVFWLIIVPFLEIRDYNLSLFLIGMHSLNAVFLLGDAVLNSLRFPWFRISYFYLWTATYVFFQWILHACAWIWWPYPFLDLSSPYAPLWYLIIGLMHIPCYAIFVLILKMKHSLLSKWFPQSYRTA